MGGEVSVSLNEYANNPGQTPKPLVAILMGTKNGERFLAEQLDSLETQTHENWVLYVSDDGSTDNTLSILKDYQAKWPPGKMIISAGPQQGFCTNFLSLACDPSMRADFYAFCDQDDTWLTNKLAVAINHIRSNQSRNASEKRVPYLYCGRTTYVNEKNQPIGMSPLFVFPPSFRNALVQSIAGGNTMVFNHEAKEILERTGVQSLPSHDWWLYLLITGIGGYVFYDQNPYVLYRQHDDSVVGENRSMLSKFHRAYTLLRGRFRDWNTKHIKVLCQAKSELTPDHQEILRLFKLLREAKLVDRIRLMEVCGLYRQTWRGTMSLIIASLFKKI